MRILLCESGRLIVEYAQSSLISCNQVRKWFKCNQFQYFQLIVANLNPFTILILTLKHPKACDVTPGKFANSLTVFSSPYTLYLSYFFVKAMERLSFWPLLASLITLVFHCRFSYQWMDVTSRHQFLIHRSLLFFTLTFYEYLYHSHIFNSR